MKTIKEQIKSVCNKLIAMPDNELSALIKKHTEGDIAKALIFAWQNDVASQPIIEPDAHTAASSVTCGFCSGIGHNIEKCPNRTG